MADTLNIFIASPRNLVKERNIAKEVANRVNIKYGEELDISIRIHDSQDVLPGYGRPQEKINEYVDKCDLFIGLLYMVWGQPTGEHSSGFFEEYSRVLERREATSSPEIWLYFKKITNECRDDPGTELLKVIKFKEEIKKENRIYYSEFKNEKNWEEEIEEKLVVYSITLFKDRLESIKREPIASIPESEKKQEEDKKLISASYQGELTNLFRNYLESFLI